ncbi:universal stress protein family protein [Klebsormidium nitens]|uniref:Universal stress protein family protein n=1 Tax=Klebsormidium nitens TaxID=105231 RepID=A0A1Y1I2T9_KLENI|nr:universal stress protein family protein [Klebsormidium nitens]|eukprot:GAQ83056.1 universal stress protein family protein [Klebsormidium nitens]
MASGKRVLCAIDGSEGSEQAFRFAAEKLATGPGDSLILFQAVTALDEYDDVVGLHILTEQQRDIMQSRLNSERIESLEKLREGLKVDSEIVVIPGDPRTVIPEYVASHPVDVVVVGTRGLNKLQTIFMGSVSSHLVQNCTVPVVIVPPRPKK